MNKSVSSFEYSYSQVSANPSLESDNLADIMQQSFSKIERRMEIAENIKHLAIINYVFLAIDTIFQLFWMSFNQPASADSSSDPIETPSTTTESETCLEAQRHYHFLMILINLLFFLSWVAQRCLHVHMKPWRLTLLIGMTIFYLAMQFVVDNLKNKGEMGFSFCQKEYKTGIVSMALYDVGYPLFDLIVLVVIFRDLLKNI